MNISESLKHIYNHFGEEAQLEKLREEVEELIEAIKEKDLQHITEEIADVYVVIAQIESIYGIDTNEVIEICETKMERTLERIKSGYYKGGKNENTL